MQINYITYDSWWDTDVTIIPELAKRFRVNVFCLNPIFGAKYPHKKLSTGISFTQVYLKYRDRDPHSLIVAFKYLWKCYLKQRDKHSLYFVIPGKNPYFLFLMLCFFPRRRTIISSHNYLEHGDNRSLGASLGIWLKKKIYSRFKFFHFFSKLQNELFMTDYPAKISFYTDMPPKDFGEATPKKRADSQVVLLFFGLIRDYKRLDILIEAVNRLNNSHIKVVIAGNASKRDIEKYNKLIQKKEKFELHYGFVQNEDIPGYFVNSDFLVLPYESATQSGPSLVAINYGIPIIASKIPAFEEHIKEGKNGFLFENGCVESLNAILKKISHMTRDEISAMKAQQMEYKKEYIKKNNVSFKFEEFIKKSL